MIETVERPAVKAAIALSAEDAARVQALIQRPTKPRDEASLGFSAAPSAVWNPASSARFRAIEAGGVLAIMAYFASAVLPALGLI